VSKGDLQARIWPDTFVQEANLGVLVSELRAALQDTGRQHRYIRTVHGFGYAFDAGANQDPVPAAPPGAVGSVTSSRSIAGAWRWLGVLAALAVVVFVTSAFPRWRTSEWEPLRRAIRLTIELPSDMPLAPAGLVSPAHDRPALALSPDAGLLAYVALIGDRTTICVRDMQTGETKRLEHTVGGHTPFFSPDGTQLAFFADNKLKAVPARGGVSKVLADAPNPWGGCWGPNGTVVFTAVEGDGILTVSERGGPVQPVVGGLRWMPEVLGPMGLLASDAHGTWHFKPGNLSSPTFVVNGRSARCVGRRILVYAADSRIEAVGFDSTRVKVTSQPVTIAEGLRTAPYAVAQFAVSEDGTLVYAGGTPQQRTRFVWVDRQGKTMPFAGLPEGNHGAYALSPDGDRLAYTLDGAVWVYAAGRGEPRRLSSRPGKGSVSVCNYPLWTSDGYGVIYTSRSLNQAASLILAASDGSETPVEIWRASQHDPDWLYPVQVVDGGKKLMAFGPSASGAMDIFLVPLRGRGGSDGATTAVRALLETPFTESFGQVSPDGRWLLFASDREGRTEIYVTSYPVPGRVTRVSRNGGREPMWNPAAPEIVYASGLSMVAVPVNLGAEFQAGEPQVLFTGAFPDITGFGYQMSEDGRHFLMLENTDFLRPTVTLNVVTNVLDLVHQHASRIER
jgi:Tol biopolymer transport system component